MLDSEKKKLEESNKLRERNEETLRFLNHKLNEKNAPLSSIILSEKEKDKSEKIGSSDFYMNTMGNINTMSNMNNMSNLNTMGNIKKDNFGESDNLEYLKPLTNFTSKLNLHLPTENNYSSEFDFKSNSIKLGSNNNNNFNSNMSNTGNNTGNNTGSISLINKKYGNSSNVFSNLASSNNQKINAHQISSNNYNYHSLTNSNINSLTNSNINSNNNSSRQNTQTNFGKNFENIINNFDLDDEKPRVVPSKNKLDNYVNYNN